MAEDSFLTFEETMGRLNLTEEQLLNMVAANEIRAFMKDREMHFRDGDISEIEEKGIVSADELGSENVESVISTTEGASEEEAPELVLLDSDEDEEGEEEVLLLDEDEDGLVAASEAATVKAASSSDTIMAAGSAGEEEEDIDISDMLLEEPSLEDSLADEIPDTEPLVQEDDAEGTVVLDEGDDILVDVEPEEEVGVLAETSASGDVGLGTEEIVFEDDDLSIGFEDEDGMATEEVTVQEEAIDIGLDDEEEGLTVVEDAVSATVAIDDSVDELAVDDDEPATASRRSRSSARSSVRRSSRGSEKIDSSSLIWAIPIAAAFLISLLPLTAIMAEIYQGFSLKGGAFTGGEVDTHGMIPEMGGIFVPEHLASIIGVDSSGNPDEGGALSWLGEPIKPDNKITLEGFSQKYGKLPEARVADISPEDRPAKQIERKPEPAPEAAPVEEEAAPSRSRRATPETEAKPETPPAEAAPAKAAEPEKPAAEEKPAAAPAKPEEKKKSISDDW